MFSKGHTPQNEPKILRSILLQSGETESVYRTIKEDSLDKLIYIGVTAVDGTVNESPLSNLVSVVIVAPTTTTRTTPTPGGRSNVLALQVGHQGKLS